MKIVRWNDIINSGKEYIYLIGYGSLINKRTWHDNTNIVDFVEAKGFKRIFNVTIPESAYEYTTNRELNALGDNVKKYKLKDPICKEGNNGGLNCIFTGNSTDKVNGLLLKINQNEFTSYEKREDIYYLYETDFNVIDPKTGKTKKNIYDKKAYILVGKEEKIKDNVNPYNAYQLLCEIGAYEWGEYFYETYLKTTYLWNGKLIDSYIKNNNILPD